MRVEEIKKTLSKRLLGAAKKLNPVPVHRASEVGVAGQEVNAPTPLRCSVSYNKYGGYCVPVSSRNRPAARAILSNEVYEPETINCIVAHCGHGDVLHAGTYFGDFLPALSGSIADGAIVWAFEPNAENYRCARITCEVNYIENVVLRHAGLGSSRGRMLVKTADEGGQALGGRSRIVHPETREPGVLAPVDVVVIDEMIPPDRHVSVIQLDVEGFEEEALAGARATINRCRPLIIVEMLPGSSLLVDDWISTNLLALGYRHVTTVHGNWVLKC